MTVYDFMNFAIKGDTDNFKRGCEESDFLVRHASLSFDVFRSLIENNHIELFEYYMVNVKFEVMKLTSTYISTNIKDTNPIILKMIVEKFERDGMMVAFVTECKTQGINYKDYLRV